MMDKFNKVAFGTTLTGIGVMALGSALAAPVVGMIGATTATVAGLSLGAKMVWNKLRHGDMFPDQDSPDMG